MIDFILHIDAHLGAIIAQYGGLTYAILGLLIFAETGFVLTPILPGDSLLFAAGAFAAIGSLNIVGLLVLLSLAAIIGDSVNYSIGYYFGQAMLKHEKIPLNQEHVDRTQAFYDKHGGKTIVLARFFPIIRTFAPFVAGIGRMPYQKFLIYNLVGGVVWVTLFTLGGYYFGNIPAVREHFTLVVLAIIAVSLLPMVWSAVKHRRKR